jgi:hypothetical protein
MQWHPTISPVASKSVLFVRLVRRQDPTGSIGAYYPEDSLNGSFLKTKQLRPACQWMFASSKYDYDIKKM